MASHRRPRTPLSRSLTTTGPRAAIGLTSAALATVTLLSETASAVPAQPSQPSIEEVQQQVDSLNHQAEVATQRYDQAQQTTETQRRKAEQLLDQVASGAQKLNDTRRVLGQYAAAEYRSGGLGNTARFFLSSNPQQYFDQTHLMSRETAKQREVLSAFETQQAQAARQRTAAAKSLQALAASQQQLAAQKEAVQKKLAQAQDLLNSLTAQQKARLAALRKQQEEEAARKAAEIAAEQKAQQQQQGSGSSSGSSGSSSGSVSGGSHAARAARAVAFARAQLGKPYVWGASGPNSYDCSGLMQAAWAAAGVSLPRTTWDQINAGTRVSVSDLQPGDLIFYYSDISHVAMYIGNGQMIQAPHTGAVVDIQPITEMPISGATRPS